tara:strand:- start:48 stop:344 length:297 start_codon:yes stop_codon:yes gene_type:complete
VAVKVEKEDQIHLVTMESQVALEVVVELHQKTLPLEKQVLAVLEILLLLVHLKVMLEEQDLHFKVTHMVLEAVAVMRRLVHVEVVLLAVLVVMEVLQQ